jgi:hypothetical protein
MLAIRWDIVCITLILGCGLIATVSLLNTRVLIMDLHRIIILTLVKYLITRWCQLRGLWWSFGHCEFDFLLLLKL